MAIWILYALFSAFFASLIAIFGKIGIQNIDTTLATTIRAIVMAALLFVSSLFLGKLSSLHNINAQAFALIVFSGLAGALSWFFYFLALKNGPAVSVAALDRLSVIFVAILAFFFLKENISMQSWAGLVLIVLGAILITL